MIDDKAWKRLRGRLERFFRENYSDNPCAPRFLAHVNATERLKKKFLSKADMPDSRLFTSIRDVFGGWCATNPSNTASAEKWDEEEWTQAGKKRKTNEGQTAASKTATLASASSTSSSLAATMSTSTQNKSRGIVPSSGKGGGKGSAKNSPGPSKTASTRSTGKEQRAPWKEQEVLAHTAFEGEISGPVCKLREDDEPTTAKGYMLCSKDAAAKVTDRFLGRATEPIVLVLPPSMTPKDVEQVKRGLEVRRNNIHSHNNSAENGNDATISVDPSITPSDIAIRDPNTGHEQGPIRVWLVHFSQWDRLMPKHKLQDQDDACPTLVAQAPSTTDLAVTVCKPMCEEMGLGEWWKSISSKTVEQAKKDMQARFLNTDVVRRLPRLAKDRSFFWRGEKMEDAAMRFYFTVEKEKTEELLARSGLNGTLVEHTERQEEEGVTKILLPIDWKLADCIEKVKALPQLVKRMTKGIIPSRRGYSVRVAAEHRATVVRTLLPEKAEEAGAALDLKRTSTWTVRGLPKRMEKQEVMRVMATTTLAWKGWIVLPTRQVGHYRDFCATWIVDADEPPPQQRLSFLDYNTREKITAMITQQECPPRQAGVKQTAWDLPPQTAQKKQPRWEDLDDTDNEGMDTDRHENDSSDVQFGGNQQLPHTPIQPEAPAGTINISPGSLSAVPPKANGTPPKVTDGRDQLIQQLQSMIAALQATVAEKDAQLVQMNANLQSLSAQIASKEAAMLQMQQSLTTIQTMMMQQQQQQQQQASNHAS